MYDVLTVKNESLVFQKGTSPKFFTFDSALDRQVPSI